MINKIFGRFINGLLIACMTITMCACTGSDAENEEIPTLIDPVSVSVKYIEATEMTLYKTTILSGVVTPEVYELSFESGQSFSYYAKMPGDSAKAKDALIYADTKALDEQIKNKKEYLSNMLTSYNEYMAEANESLVTREEDYEKYSKIMDSFNSYPDELKDSYGSGRAFFESEKLKYDNLFRTSYLNLERLKENIKEKSELFTLDYNYQNSQYKKLKNQKSTTQIKSPVDGSVCAINFYNSGDYVNGGSPVVAVADTSVKKVLTDYVNKGTINTAKDYYAIVNGKRYEVDYKAIDADEYERLNELNGKVNSTFTLIDPANEINMADYVSIVIISNVKENCICVPSDAINTAEDKSKYVYLFDGENTELVYVKVGSSEGDYVEITSGISAGDKIISNTKAATGSKTTKVEQGTVGANFSASGYLYYPTVEWIQNPVEYGTIYVDEICVSRYQKVEKGDVIAKIHVVKDSIAIKRQERNLQRMEEDLADLIEADADKEEKDKTNTKAIEAQQESISELKETIDKMKSDAKVTEIKAPYGGIITDVKNYSEGDLCNSKANIACIAEEGSNYIIVEDETGKLTMGNIAGIEYTSSDGQKKTVSGKVVNVTQNALSKQMETGYALISIPGDAIGDMAGSSMGYEGWWNRSRFTVSVNYRTMDNVIVVPKAAVYGSNGNNYVYIIDSEGKISPKSVVVGGSDTSYSWIVEGLTEGMTVCLE